MTDPCGKDSPQRHTQHQSHYRRCKQRGGPRGPGAVSPFIAHHVAWRFRWLKHRFLIQSLVHGTYAWILGSYLNGRRAQRHRVRRLTIGQMSRGSAILILDGIQSTMPQASDCPVQAREAHPHVTTNATLFPFWDGSHNSATEGTCERINSKQR